MNHPIVHYLDKGAPCVISGLSTAWEEATDWYRSSAYKKGETFVFEGDTQSKFVYVKSGCVHGQYYEGDGASRTNLIFKSGSLINETAIVAHSFSIRLIFICVTPCVLYWFNGDIIHNHDFRSKYEYLLNNMFYSSSTKLLHVQAVLNAACTRDSMHLTCWYLYSMCMYHHRQLEFRPDVSQTEMSSLLGISYSSMKRNLAELRTREIVSYYTKNRIVINDMEGLADLARPNILSGKK